MGTAGRPTVALAEVIEEFRLEHAAPERVLEDAPDRRLATVRQVVGRPVTGSPCVR